MTPADLLERSQWDLFWLPPDTTVIDRPDLLLVTSPRPVAYLNTVLRARAATPDLPALIDEVEAWSMGTTPRWMVTDTFDRAPLEAALASQGYAPGESHEVRALPVDGWAHRGGAEVRRVTTRETLLDCVEVSERAFGGGKSWTEASLAADLRQCTHGTRVSRFVGYVDGKPAASGGLTAFPELGFGLLWAGCAVPELRGRGAYSAVLGARIERARELGLTWVGLYARGSTSAPIVARMGFHHHGGMTFWGKAS